MSENIFTNMSNKGLKTNRWAMICLQVILDFSKSKIRLGKRQLSKHFLAQLQFCLVVWHHSKLKLEDPPQYNVLH